MYVRRGSLSLQGVYTLISRILLDYLTILKG